MTNKQLNINNLDLSSFTIQVLKTIQKIPVGKVITYATLAKAVGSPRSARAVGNALHINPFAPQVPCHRVIKSDGTLGGYGWGQSAKLKILKNEGVDFDGNLKIKDPSKILIKI